MWSASVQNQDRFVSSRTVEYDGIYLPVASGAADCPGQVHVDLGHGGAGQVVNGDGVGAAAGVDDYDLDVSELQFDVVHVAGHYVTVSVGQDVDSLGDVRAVQHQLVQAALPVDGVAAVARVPDEGVGTRAAQHGVVPGAGVHGQPDQRARVRLEQARGIHRVVAAEGVHRQRVGRLRGSDERDVGQPAATAADV